MKYLILLLSLGTVSLLQAQEIIHTVKDPMAVRRKVGSFNALQVEGAIDVYLTQSDETAVAVSASSEEFRDAIVTEVRGNTLFISFKYKSAWYNNVNPKIKAYVSVARLEIGRAHV